MKSSSFCCYTDSMYEYYIQTKSTLKKCTDTMNYIMNYTMNKVHYSVNIYKFKRYLY